MTVSNLTNTRNSYLSVITKLAALSALLGTLAPAFAVTLLTGLRNGSLPHPLDSVEKMLLLCPITAVSCGPFTVLAGVAGGTAIYLRRRRIRSTRRLLIESALAGLLLSCLFPFFDAAMNLLFLKSFELFVIPLQILLCPILGIACALTCSLTFRNHFVQQNDPPNA
jgi:hypothetical protein